MVQRYRTVRLPEELVNEIERVIKKHKKYGYRSIAEFVAEAVRRRIEEIEKEENREMRSR